jgi:hypothetical protein
MSVLVTGATGTVGSVVVKQLVAAGLDVRAFTRSPEKATFPRGVTPFKGELLDVDALRAAIDGIEAVFLLSPVVPDGCVWRPGDAARNVPWNIQSELWSFTPRPIRGDLRHRLVCRARARRSGALRRTRYPARRGRVEHRRDNQHLQDRHRAQALGGADSRLFGQEGDAEGVLGHVHLDSRKGLQSEHCPGAARISAATNICRLGKEIH